MRTGSFYKGQGLCSFVVWAPFAENVSVLKLLEIQRQSMLMYTSCGWFFEDISGIETVQILQYAGMALQLSEGLSGNSLERGFLERIEKVKSNIDEHGDGRRIYEKFVKPAMVDLKKVAAHYAISSLFEEYGETADVYAAAITVAPRFFSELIEDPQTPPFGNAIWGDAILPYPSGAKGRRYRNVFTDEILETTEQGSMTGFFLRDIFTDFPVALLDSVSNGEEGSI